MNRKKSILTIITMAAGMALGLIILLSMPNKDHINDLKTLLHPSKSTINIKEGKQSVIGLIQALKAKHRIDQLMRQDSLSAADSTEIKNIDQLLNQMLHD